VAREAPPVAARASIAHRGVAEVAADRRLEIALGDDILEVRVRHVGATHEGRQPADLEVAVDGDGEPDRSSEPDGGAGRVLDGVVAGQDHVARLELALELDFVQVTVAAHQHRDRFAVGDVDQCLDQILRRDPKKCRDLLDGSLARGGDPLDGGRCRRCGNRRAGAGFLDVGRVVAAVARQERVLAGLGQDLELVRERAADGTGVGLDRAKGQPATPEDARVRVVHVLVLALRILLGGVERIGVLHDELAATHEARPRPQLVAELRLNLEQVEGELPVTAHVAAHQVHDDLFVRRADDEVGPFAVLEAQELLAVLVPAPRLLPQLAGDDGRQKDLLATGAVHLLADDARHLVDHAPAERQEGIHPRRYLAQVTASHHEDVGGDLSLGRGFFEGRNQGLRKSHGEGF